MERSTRLGRVSVRATRSVEVRAVLAGEAEGEALRLFLELLPAWVPLAEQAVGGIVPEVPLPGGRARAVPALPVSGPFPALEDPARGESTILVPGPAGAVLLPVDKATLALPGAVGIPLVAASVLSTGAVGYVSDKTFRAILDAATRPLWIVSFVLRMFPYDACQELFEERGVAPAGR